ncbi:MAG: tyrosine--tRNA ligase [Candidatus Aminicenantales bacterium]
MDKIDEVLTRRVDKIYPSKEALEKILRSGKKIKLYLGIDPTGGDLHLGHAVPLMKLQEFVKLGHHVIFLVGNFTALCGDPSGHEGARKRLTPAQITKNMATYKKQASKILDFSKTEMKYNADWLAKLSFAEIIKLASHFTVQQMIERSLFQRRLKAKKPIHLHEFLYPLLQGYDSVAMNVDLEMGGTDQTFNMLAGRTLQKIYNKKEKFVLTTKMITGLDGKAMSKTSGNTVNILNDPNDMYGKIMSLHDDLIIQYFEMCTNVPLQSIKAMEKDMRAGKINPMDLKKKLAFEIVKMLHSEKDAKNAGKEFERVFQKRKQPSEPPSYQATKKRYKIVDLLVDTRLASSKSEAKRLIERGGVDVDGKVMDDTQKVIRIKDGSIIRVGKRRFIKISA